jgi:hypothetical protein
VPPQADKGKGKGKGKGGGKGKWLQWQGGGKGVLSQAGKGGGKGIRTPVRRVEWWEGRWLHPFPGAGCSPIVNVIAEDNLVAAERFVRDGNTVAVLNMACAHKAGGGLWKGCGAQEENLYRRTDALRFSPCSAAAYPLDGGCCLVLEGVTVLRGSEQDGYPFLPDPFLVTVLSCAAPSKPRLRRDNQDNMSYANNNERLDMEQKVAVIVQAAKISRRDVIVLSAFGCGAFGNPPELVAAAFRDKLANSDLTRVVFTIAEDHNSRGNLEHNRRGNFVPFKEVFP